MSQNILQEAEQILGHNALQVERHRAWATFWCPFHGDAERAGLHGRPNFGVNLQNGSWKCLRCSAAGGSLQALRKALGQDWHALPVPLPVQATQIIEPQVAKLNQALALSRAALRASPAWEYLRSRGISPATALLYGLGYGIYHPQVSPQTQEAAEQSGLVSRKGYWLWGGGVVYADPPLSPAAIQVRHLRPHADKKYQTWGRRETPLGAWRLRPQVNTLIVVEGMFDFLTVNQVIRERGREDLLCVFTGGASPNAAMLHWFAEHRFTYILLPDPDAAGTDWTRVITKAIPDDAVVKVFPLQSDPDEAFLSGWWPPGL